MFGPLTIVQVPVPFEGVLAASVAGLVRQMLRLAPALAVVAAATTVIVTVEVEEGQPAELMVQRRIYVPIPPAGVNTAFLFVILLNCALLVLGPLSTSQLPEPTEGRLADKVAVPVLQMVCGEPALETVG